MNLLPQDEATIARVSAIYQHFQKECTDSVAASNLTLAAINAGVESVQPGSVLTVTETAERLKLSEDCVYDLCAAGKLNCKRISAGKGKRPAVRIPLTSLLAYLGELSDSEDKPSRGLRQLKVRA